MLHILPTTDLEENLTNIEELVEREGEIVYLTKNGYGSMVLMNMDSYENLMPKPEKKEAKTASNKTQSKKINIQQPEVMDD